MVEDTSVNMGGWQIGRSIALELDVLLSGVRGVGWSAAFHQEFSSLVDKLPAGWIDEWDEMLGRPLDMVALMDEMAYLAGVFGEEDYQTATLAMRKLSTSEMLDRLSVFALPFDIHPDLQLDQTERLIDLDVRLSGSLYPSFGVQYTDTARYERGVRNSFTHLVKIARNGELHDRFWMWLDRLYFETYQPWRVGRLEFMARAESHAILSLGDRQKAGVVPAIDWLPAQNPLHMHPFLLNGVHSQKLRIFFWVEPFGLADLWSLFPNQLVVSIAEPGAIYERFGEKTANLACRVQALADPNRLAILRIIRHFGMINTEIARFMGLQRPTVSVHAKLLRKAGLITSHKDGREMRHEIVPGALQKLLHDLEILLDLPDEGDDGKTRSE
ncbi:MAG: metalloregulator ArsR/SmtB family transcription factor [Anaerolineaceae bacterium]